MGILTLVAAFFTGLLASMGVGSPVLIIWLTAFAGYSQFDAQGINLLFFLPIAALSVIMHCRNGFVEFGKLAPAIITGLVGAAAGFFAARLIDPDMLGNIFSLFILFVGIRELFGGIRARKAAAEKEKCG